jgi:hypothetical protein
MSAISTFAFRNVIIFPGSRCACAHVCVPEVIQQAPAPGVRAKWTVETEQDGSRRLVQHWFREETSVESSRRSRSKQ